MNLFIVVNLGGAATLALAVAAWGGAQIGGFDTFKMVAGFGTMALLGSALELQPAQRWKPRYFWIIPGWLAGWLAGLGGTGLALLDVSTVLGNLTLGAAGLAMVAILGAAIMRKPGGRWLAGLTGSGAVVMGFQIISDARPEWRTPALTGTNAVAMLACAVCGWMLYRARQQGAASEGNGATAGSERTSPDADAPGEE